LALFPSFFAVCLAQQCGLALRTGTKFEGVTMLDHDDLRWIAANVAELNRLLQQIAHLTDKVRQHKGEGPSLEILAEQVEKASKTSQSLFDCVTSRIVAGEGSKVAPLDRPPGPKTVATAAAHTKVSVKTPVGEVALAGDDASDPPILNPQGTRELILVVDDDPELLELAGSMLEFEDYRVITAKDGLEALKIYRRMGKEISLIILDYFLPVMDGDAVFDELKAIDPEVQVVLSSGFGEQATLGGMLARGLRGFLPKPYTHEKLIEQIRSIIET
jgi:CheY-like chemotaxis protein